MATKKTEPKEATIVNNIMKYLKSLDNTIVIKTHGGAFGKRGTPDLIGSYKGRAFAFEVKRPSTRLNTTELQKKGIRDWLDAGAISGVVTSVEEVQHLLYQFQKWTMEYVFDDWKEAIEKAEEGSGYGGL